jgi:hypothetical protein
MKEESLTSKRKNKWDKNTIGPKESLKQMTRLRVYLDGDLRIINLTPHVIQIDGMDGREIYIPRSGAELRISTKPTFPIELGFTNIETYEPDYNRLNIYFKRQGSRNLDGRLPTAAMLDRGFPNTYFLASRIAARYLAGYKRILVVGIPGLKEHQPHLSLYHDESEPYLY